MGISEKKWEFFSYENYNSTLDYLYRMKIDFKKG